MTRSIVLLGAPLELGAGRLGTCMGPASLRTAGLAGALRDLGHDVRDEGDMPPPLPATEYAPQGAKHAPLVAAWARTLSARVFATAQEGALPFVLGGDHAVAMGSVNGMARHARAAGKPLFVLWLDAHADFNTPLTSPSGNMHGMPVALATGEDGFGALLGEEPAALVPHGHIHLFGIRSLDRDERALLRARGIEVTDMRLIDEHGVMVPMRRFLDRVATAGGLLHVSLDVDFLDPAIAPGAGTPVPGGATYREAHLLMELLHDSRLVTSLDIVELNPFLDERGRSALLLVDLAASLFGRQIIAR